MEALQRKAALLKHIENYPNKFPFPAGLILFGTINVDETTHLPSPKFLDRSLTIQVSGTKLPEDLGTSTRTSSGATSADFSWALSLATAQRCLEEGTKLNSKAQETWKLLIKWNEQYFKPLGIRLSHRLPQVYRCYMGAAATLKISDHQQVADTFVLSKIMPLITFRDGDASETLPQESKRDVLERWRDGKDKRKTVMMDMTGFPLVLAALEAMLARPSVIVRYLE